MNGDFSRLGISNLTNEDHIRILADNGTQRISKGESDGWLHLNLIDPFQLIFHRVFYRDDLLLRGVDLLQGTIESCCLPTSGWTGDKNDPIGPLDEFIKSDECIFWKTKLLNV